MVLGEFSRKFKEASCHLRQTEPFSIWLNAVEKEIMELKKGSGRKLIRSGAPKRHWDDYLELESYIKSNAAHGIYKLDEEEPEAIMSRETSNTSQIHEIEWFKWVIFFLQNCTIP